MKKLFPAQQKALDKLYLHISRRTSTLDASDTGTGNMKTEPRTLNTLVKWINRHPHYNVDIRIDADTGFYVMAYHRTSLIAYSYGSEINPRIERVMEAMEEHRDELATIAKEVAPQFLRQDAQ